MTGIIGTFVPHKRPASQGIFGGYVGDITNISPSGNTMLGNYNAWDESTRNEMWKYRETLLYPDYDRLVMENPFAMMVLNFLQAEIYGDGFHVEGPDKDIINEFYNMDNTVYKTSLAGHDAIKYGTGAHDIMYDRRWRKAPSRTRVIDGSTIRLSMDNTTGERKYAQVNRGGAEKPLDGGLMMTYHMVDRPGYAYPMSLFRPNMNFFRSLVSAGNDIFTVIERVGYAPIVASLDVSDVDTADKTAMINNFTSQLEKTQTAKMNFVKDKRHELDLLGDGGNSAQLLDSTKMMVPIISVCLLNFGMPIGYFLQEGANRSVLDQQKDGIRRFINMRRYQNAREHEMKLFPRLVGNTDNYVVWPDGFRDRIELMKQLNQLYISKAISREHYLDELNIIDEGKTFYDGGGEARLQTDEGGRSNVTGEPRSD